MRRIKSSPSAILTFLFLFSGNIIFNLYYKSGNPLMCFLITSLSVFVFAILANAVMKRRKNKGFPKIIKLAFAVTAFVCLCFTMFAYTRLLGTFADFYAQPHVSAFAVVSVVLSGFFAAKRKINGLTGFAYMTYAVMIVWTLIGFLGFFHTRKLVIAEMFSVNVTSNNIVEMIKTTLFMIADIVLVFFTVEGDNVEKCGDDTVGVVHGVVSYMLLCGINIGKNVLMFGADFISGLENPDLAAIRLIPNFELPEISVIVNTFAITLRAMLYLRVILHCAARKNGCATDCDRIFMASSI